MAKKGTTKKTITKLTREEKNKRIDEYFDNPEPGVLVYKKPLEPGEDKKIIEKIKGIDGVEVVEENTIELVEEEEPVEILEERPAETPEEEIEEETEEEAIELIDEPSEEDKEMVEDVVNIINGLSGIRSGDKKKVISTTEEKETERPLDTAKKEEQGQTFSNTWGGVIYDY